MTSNASTVAELTPGLMRLLAAAIFAAAGTIHYQTPMLAAIGTSFHADLASTGWIATATFGGFLAGIVLLVPLGDRFDKRRLILVLLAFLLVALATMALAPSLGVAIAASLVIGVCASLGQIMVPIVAELAPPQARGRAMGTLLTALFLGILFARISGGFVASRFGWRWSYALPIAMLGVLAPLLVARLPHLPPRTELRYGALLWSLVELVRAHEPLRRVMATQALLGVCYGGLWATVAAMLAAFHRLGPTEAGLMGIPGAAGVLVARPAGRWMDRSGARPVVLTGIALVIAAWIAFGFAPFTMLAAIAGAALMDCGLRAAMVANQTLVTAALPDARSRANTIFGAAVWGGNATGTFLASTAFTHAGWLAVCLLAILASATAFAVQLRRG